MYGSFKKKDGEVLLQLKKHKSGIYYREDTSDLLSIRECNRNYKDVSVLDKVVLDLGSNIGGFSYIAAQNGAKAVYSFEPEPHNFSLLEFNLSSFNNCHVYDKVVTNSIEDSIQFYIGYGKGAPSLASTRNVRGRYGISVKNENFKRFVNKINPELIKIDIEGGEYDIISDIPDSCKEFGRFTGLQPLKEYKKGIEGAINT
jgi:FkbM family methyltransferase